MQHKVLGWKLKQNSLGLLPIQNCLHLKETQNALGLKPIQMLMQNNLGLKSRYKIFQI